MFGTVIRRGWIVALGVGGVIGGMAVVARAAIPGADGVIAACYKTSGGSLRVVEPGEACKAGETPLSWSHTGPQGLPGPQGEPGPQESPVHKESPVCRASPGRRA